MGAPTSGSRLPLNDLLKFIDKATNDVKDMLQGLESEENVGIGQMFKIQMAMNKLAQVSEMSSSVTNASNQSLQSLARNIK